MTVCTPRALRIALLATLVSAASLASAAAPAHFTQDPAKSTLEYAFVQAGAQNKGAFKKYSTTLDFAADNLAASKLDVVVDMASLDTGDKERDDTLRSADLFNIAKYPQARFTSAQIAKTAAGYEAVGKLTLRGVSRDTHVPFTLRTVTELGKRV
jgi:polyisoprenoid-binding protein YceI